MGLAFSCSPSGERGVKYFVEQYMQVLVMVFEHAAFIIGTFIGIARMMPFLFKAVMLVTI